MPEDIENNDKAEKEKGVETKQSGFVTTAAIYVSMSPTYILPGNSICKMPYLTFSTQHRDGSTSSDTEVQARLSKLQDAKAKHDMLLNIYTAGRAVIHGPPTLDESYYHFASDPDSTSDQLKRNETQVVTSFLLGEKHDQKPSSWPLL